MSCSLNPWKWIRSSILLIINDRHLLSQLNTKLQSQLASCSVDRRIMGEFEMNIEHKPGLKHSNAKGLSRGYYKQCM